MRARRRSPFALLALTPSFAGAQDGDRDRFFDPVTEAGQHARGRVAGVEAGRLAGISLGVVFLGAMTYIGNGPNFMVKAIAEGAGVRMPNPTAIGRSVCFRMRATFDAISLAAAELVPVIPLTET